MTLEVGRKYFLFSGDVISVVDECMSLSPKPWVGDAMMLDGSDARLCLCELTEFRRSQLQHLNMCMYMVIDFKGKKAGDRMIYLGDSGHYCGWDHRAHPLHVRQEEV